MAPRRTLLLNGPTSGLSSFALINRRLVAGLSRAGYDVWPVDTEGLADRAELPDVCLTHGHPYDALNAPGGVNIFFLEYDYGRITRADRPLRDGLATRFDLCVAPSTFVHDACRASGLDVPVAICPLGVDFDEFHPQAEPAPLDTRKRFRFVYVGGASERKGVDILVQAFRSEFGADEDVVLVLKTFSYDHLRPWLDALLGQAKNNGPQIIHAHSSDPSIAGYFTAADVGVFPFRGEAFALPILECLASGTPVIVTRGGGPADYCTADNAAFIRARRKTCDGKSQLEPDVAHLRQLMRTAYEGRHQRREPNHVRHSVAHLTWERTVETLVAAIDECIARKRATATAGTVPVVHAHGQVGRTSWKKVSASVEAALRARFVLPTTGQAVTPGPVTSPRLRAHSLMASSLRGRPSFAAAARVIVAQSGFALEHFAAAQRRGSHAQKLLVRGNGPFDTVLRITNRERQLCGLEPTQPLPMEFWRNRHEERLANIILVHSQATARHFTAHGWPAQALRVVPLGFTASRPQRRAQGTKLRFLFLGTDPFRKGIRLLLAAWDALRPRHAELVCLVNTEVLRSPLLLRSVVRNPSVMVRPLVSHAQLAREYDAADCQVLPSHEDGFALAVADGMGRGLPAIVSDETGISELLTDKHDGWLVESGSVDSLRTAIAHVCDNPAALDRMSTEAYTTARRRPWSDFKREVGDIVASLIESKAP